ncbi:hypothetical protein ACIKT0_03975 [Hansschlegelia beijingensis]|uniref:hypothetical protein n=1 Tax=Hansschlegelia beijingensis TaxID=1133344 RepID=UPI00387F0058
MRSRLVGLVLLLAAGPVAAAELVPPKDLQASWFDGKAISTTGPRGGKATMTFSPDGKLTRTGGRAGAARQGTWRLDEDGFCMRLGEAKRDTCYLALKNPDGSLRVVRRSGGAFTWSR